GDTRLEDVPVQAAGGDVIALAHDEIGDLQLTGPRRRRDDDVREERSEDEVHLVLGRELLDDLGATLWIGAVVLGDDLDGPAADAALLVDELHRGGRRPVVPPAVRRADAGPVDLEAQPERRRLRGGAPDPRARRRGAEREGATRPQERASRD